MKMYVGNLPYQASEDDIRQAFEEHGAVSSVTIIKDRFSGQSKGFGFVEMGSDAEAKAAMTSLDGMEFKGRKLTVNEARPMTDRGGRDRDRGGRGGGDRDRGDRGGSRGGGGGGGRW